MPCVLTREWCFRHAETGSAVSHRSFFICMLASLASCRVAAWDASGGGPADLGPRRGGAPRPPACIPLSARSCGCACAGRRSTPPRRARSCTARWSFLSVRRPGARPISPSGVLGPTSARPLRFRRGCWAPGGREGGARPGAGAVFGEVCAWVAPIGPPRDSRARGHRDKDRRDGSALMVPIRLDQRDAEDGSFPERVRELGKPSIRLRSVVRPIRPIRPFRSVRME